MRFAFNEKAELKRPSPEMLAKADQLTEIVCLVRGFDRFGQAVWSYVGVRPSMYGKFKTQLNAGKPMSLDQWGTVLLEGVGSRPSAEDEEYMRREYEFDDTMLAKLTSDVASQQKAAFASQESVRIDNIVTRMKTNKFC